ncbi:MAG: TlpA family protein disulfide reductase [Prevotellaceae bacterium]|jgi:thiol-disulfide isomerase/thioredoxin|nr:TlpA family protein disulfide reductase [Prevotellaceae bacterium]
MKRTLFSLAVAALVASCGGKVLSVEVGDKMPAFDMTATATSQSLLGRPSLVVFFATWCPGCQAELPYVQQLYEKYGESGKMAIVAFAREQTSADVDTLWQQQAFTFPAYADPGRKIYSLFAEKIIPRCYLFDGSGKLAYKSEGYSPEQVTELFEAVEQMLSR